MIYKLKNYIKLKGRNSEIGLSENKSLYAIQILKNNLNIIDWFFLSENSKFVSKTHKLGLKL